MMRKSVVISLFLSFLLVGPVSAADVVKMNLNAIYPATNFHSQGAEEFAKRVREYSGGTVDITVHPGGALGFKGPELLKTVKDGTVPMSDILMGVVQGSEKAFGISSLPRMVTSYDQAWTFYEACKDLYDKAREMESEDPLRCPMAAERLIYGQRSQDRGRPQRPQDQNLR